jgi:DNA-directed RNA polymerase sigma subunit (sigma70/sigma32)
MNMKRASDDYWGLLSDECEKYTDDPIGEIKRMADQAMSDRTIRQYSYPILEQRVPFPGIEKRNRIDIGKDYGVTGERIRQIEERTYNTLKMKYLK